MTKRDWTEDDLVGFLVAFYIALMAAAVWVLIETYRVVGGVSGIRNWMGSW